MRTRLRRSLPAVALLGLLGAGATAARAAADPVVEALVADVSETEATRTVVDLVACGTRYSGTAGCAQAADLLVARLQAMGYAVERPSFPWGAQTLWNVKARKIGLVRPDETYLLVAHYDSTSEQPSVLAPGADDDASGVAVVLESARVLASRDFEASVEFLLTGGEEQGLLGSQFDAGQRAAAGETLAGVINHDMVAYWPTGWARDLDVDGTPESARIVDAYAQASLDYVPGMAVEPSLDWGVCGDDQVSYHDRAWPSIIVMDCHEAHMGMEGETTPHYHRSSDTIDTLDLPRMTQVARATAATAAVLAVPIARRLYRNDEMTSRAAAGTVLRVGAPTGIDPAGAGTSVRFDRVAPAIFSGDGEPVGDGSAGVVIFYESDRPELLTLSRGDADADGREDVLVAF